MSTPTKEKTLGQIAFEAFDASLDLGDPEHWDQQGPTKKQWWEVAAQSVIEHHALNNMRSFAVAAFGEEFVNRYLPLPEPTVKQADPWVLLPKGAILQEGDQVSQHGQEFAGIVPTLVGQPLPHHCHGIRRMSFHPLPQPADPVGVKPNVHPLASMTESEKLTVIDDYSSQITDLQAERDQLRKEVEGLKGEFKNFHRLVCEVAGCEHDDKDWKRDQLSLVEHIRAKLASFQWKPVPVGGITRTDPENKLSLWISKETSETGLEWVHGISNRATYYVHVETLRELLILPPVPAETETEEQKMRREFEEWVDRENVMLVLSKLEHSGCYTSTNTQSAWAAWQAAVASRKDQPQTTEEV